MAGLRLGRRLLQPNLGDRQVGARLLVRRERRDEGKLLERLLGWVQRRLRQRGCRDRENPLHEEQERQTGGERNREPSEGRSQARDDRRSARRS
jgi:hypothetical protein